MSSDIQRLRAHDEACAALREFRGSGASVAAVALLDALERVYLQELRDVAPDGLTALQAYLKQIGKLRATLQGEPGGARV